MFVYTVRGGTVRFLALLCLTATLLLGAGLAADARGETQPYQEAVETISYTKVGTDEGRMAFIKSLGWQTTGEVIESESFTLPETFDRVLLGYNEIQKDQGLDLSRYRKKRVTRYTYEVTNFDGYEGKVYLNLIVYRGKVIAGDVSSADPMGFVQGLERKPVQNS